MPLAANSEISDRSTPYQLRTRGERAQAFREAVYAAAGLELVDVPVAESRPIVRGTSQQLVRRNF